MSQTYYITTPIYFPNDKLHLGQTYTTIAADALSRYKKLRGYEVKFLTGMDEHGQKIERKAKERGLSPQKHVDEIAEWIQDLWAKMDIEYDYFLRTTDPNHKAIVQKIFRKLYDQGDIYKGVYEGWYCTPDETFFTKRQLVDGKCPECGRDVELVQEESYFFRLSHYQEKILEYIESHPSFISPLSRQNEMISNFLKPGLEDLCVSRTSFTWGVPVEFDPGHVIYVWIDALTNYITALGYLTDDDFDFQKFWPADLHLMAKEIVRFHTIIWPALLMALGEPLPKRVVGHGWFTMSGVKMSKSRGNVVDPKILLRRYGSDAVRYFLLREMNLGSDCNYDDELLLKRMNADLANDLGNLLSRTVGMIEKYCGGEIDGPIVMPALKAEIEGLAAATAAHVNECMDDVRVSDALAQIWTFIRRMNKFADETSPWTLVKDPSQKPQLGGVLYLMAESLRIISIWLTPFMPQTPRRIRVQLGITDPALTLWDSAATFGLLAHNVKISKGEILFPRLDIQKELNELEAENNPQLTQISPDEVAKLFQAKQNIDKKDDMPSGLITIDDFSKVELKVGIVEQCEKVSGSDKLLKSQVKIGDTTRQIVSGIAKWYAPEDMVGRRIVVVTNLKPVKLRGELSEGMLLAASDLAGNLNLVTVDGGIAHGAEVR